MENSNLPLYLQLKQFLEGEIKKGAYKAHDQLPSEVELARQFDVSRITSKNAILQLVEDGKVYRIPGKGTFVADQNEANYSKEVGASILSGGRPFIGFIVPEIEDYFTARILFRIESVSTQLGYALMVQQSHHYIDVEKQAIQTMIKDGAKGLIIFPVDDETYNEEILRLTLDHFPIVLVDRYLSGIDTPAVYSDNLQGAYQLTKCLLEKGKRVALFTAPNFETITVCDRIKGFEKAYDEADIPIDRSLWFTELLHENPLERAIRFLQEHPDISGIFAMNAFAGKIAFEASKYLGKRMPDEFPIASFDEEHELGVYPIYTARQDAGLMGEKAAELLHAQLTRNNPNNFQRKVVLPVQVSTILEESVNN